MEQKPTPIEAMKMMGLLHIMEHPAVLEVMKMMSASLHGEMDGTSQTGSQEGVKPTPTVSTSDIPLPNHARTEQRTLGQYASDKLKEKMNSSRRVQNMKKTYNISKNTMESLRGGNVMKRGANNVSKPQRSNSTARSGSLANHGSGSAFRNMGENRQVTRIDSEIDEE
ncbi:hypothetical protein [Bacillus velezensis]|uniref:hypothetical protein n=1 Tax=Bacillus velezensis TaxID=492670 RepID=UPI0018E903AD|nr:hypothetical protein [Bacillus velezensis]